MMINNKENKKPFIVFLHGWGFSKSIWNEITPLFEENYNIITPNLQDFYPGITVNLQKYLNELGIENDIYIISWSMGFLLGLELAEHIKIKKTAVLSAVPYFCCDGGLNKETIKKMKNDIDISANKVIRKFYQWVFYPDRFKTLNKNSTTTYDPDFLKDTLSLLETKDLRDLPYNKNTMYFFGEKDAVLPINAIDEFHFDKKYIYKDSGHNFFIKNKTDLVVRIKNFFNEI